MYTNVYLEAMNDNYGTRPNITAVARQYKVSRVTILKIEKDIISEGRVKDPKEEIMLSKLKIASTLSNCGKTLKLCDWVSGINMLVIVSVHMKISYIKVSSICY